MAQDNNDKTKKVTTRLESEEHDNSKTTEILETAIASLTPELRKEFAKVLLPALKKLGHEYLTAKADTITTELADSLKSNQTFFSRFRSAAVALFGKVATALGFTNELTVSTKDLTKIATTFDNKHKRESNEFSENKLTERLVKSPLSKDQLASVLSTFLTENNIYDIDQILGSQQGKLITITKDNKIEVNSVVAKNFTNLDLATIRNINPQGFDVALAQEAAKPTKPVVDDKTRKEIEKMNMNPAAVEAQKIEAAKKSPPPKTPEEIQKIRKAQWEL